MAYELRKSLSALLLPLALAGCVTAPSPTFTGADQVAGAVFAVGYDRISDIYLEEEDLGVLTVDGLNGLSKIDPALGARRTQDGIEMTRAGHVIGRFDIPRPDEANGWAKVTTDAIARARDVSPAVRAATAEDIYGAVFTAITADLDPYSRYVGAERASDERAMRDGYGGVGLLIEPNDSQRPVITEVFPEGPAAQAGVEAGSVIVAVDGLRISDMERDRVADHLRGPIDSLVELTVETPAGPERSFALRRRQVVPNAVKTRYEDDVAVISVDRFNAATAEHVAKALGQAVGTLGPNADGVILDLRGNPGGLLGQSVAVADMFIPRGPIISTRGRHPDSVQLFGAESGDLTGGLPLVILVDGQSASGAEVVAAALQDSGRGVVVGAASYGKGSVQTVTRLPNDGELFLTWSRIYSPGGYTLHQQGVMPTICTSGEIKDAKEVLARFRSGELAVPATMFESRRAAPDDKVALKLLRGACPWKEHDDALDVAVAKMLLQDPALYDQALSLTSGPTIAQR